MRAPSCSFIPKEWRTYKTLFVLFALEIPFTVAALAFFGIADPNLYRTKFWQEGSHHGWNSDPSEILYAFANYRPISVPVPWSQSTTHFNVVISVLSMFILLVKAVLHITHVWYPLLSAVVHAALVALYAISIHNQAAPDMSDPKHPQPGAPWYITKSCGAPVSEKLRGYCMQAKGAFAVSIILCILFFTYFILSVYSLIPTKAQRATRHSKIADIESPQSNQSYGMRKWEFEGIPKTPNSTRGMKSPITPRTMAFNTLDGNGPMRQGNKDLPLRHHISMGTETYQSPTLR